jgi:hypothetical protein
MTSQVIIRLIPTAGKRNHIPQNLCLFPELLSSLLDMQDDKLKEPESCITGKQYSLPTN